MRTILPRRSAADKGGEFSHSVALLREDNSPSMGDRSTAGVDCCATRLSSAKVSIAAPIAPASIVASKIRFAVMAILLRFDLNVPATGRKERATRARRSLQIDLRR